MAGMSIGAGLLMAATIFTLVRSWTVWGKNALGEVLGHPLFWATLAIFLSSFFSLAGAWISPPMGEAAGGFRELKKLHHFLYPFVTALALLHSSDALERHPFWKLWGGMGIFCAIIAALQFFGGDLFPADWLQHRFFRAAGTTGRFHGQGVMFFHLSFASCLTFVAAAGLARVLWPLKWDRARQRFFWLAVAISGFLAVYFSFSRISLVGLLFVAVVLGFLKKPIWGIVALVLFAAAGAGLFTYSQSLYDRFEHSRAGIHERTLMWESAWEMFKDRPLTGFGFGRSGRYTATYAERILGKPPEFSSHAHNNILDTLAATGLLGLLAFLFWWFVLLISAWRSFVWSGEEPGRDRWLPAAALAAIIAFQVNGLTQVNFWDGKSQHTLMIWAGVVLALSLRRKRA